MKGWEPNWGQKFIQAFWLTDSSSGKAQQYWESGEKMKNQE